MEDDWQKLADDDEAVPVAAKAAIPADVNKWAGEDEDEVKDSWDADDDEKEDEEKNGDSKPSKPKKTIKQKNAEKEQQRIEIEEKRRKEKEEEEMAQLTPEQRTAAKLRLKHLQEDADTKLALETMGLTTSSGSHIDSLNPKTKEEFAEIATAISKTITQFKAEEEYVPFLDELVSKLCAGLSSTNIRRIKTSLENLQLEKSKIEKGDKPKKKAGQKVKVKLRMEGDDDYASRAGAFEADDYDDFM